MERQDLQEKMDLYISGQMPEADRLAFEAAMSTDPLLKQQLQEQSHLRGIVRSHGAHQLKKRLQKIEQGHTGKTKNPYWWLYLIIGLILAGLAYWVIQSEDESPDIKQLYAQYYQPFQPLGLNTRNQTAESWQDQYLQAYQQKDYAQVLAIFESRPDSLASQKQLDLMAGIANMESDNSEEATQIFQSVAASGDTYFTDEANWYLGLLSLEEDDVEEAKSYLQKVAQDDQSEYQQQAKELLERLP
jgi:hypothetical protein